jgi:predicted GNAT family acetyltransferase
MFQIEISAEIIDGPEGSIGQVGKLIAYRMWSPWLLCRLEDGKMSQYFWTFDAISGDACAAIEDLIAVEKRMFKKLEQRLEYGGADNLVYVDNISVDEGYRGHGISEAMMYELHDLLVGLPSLVFFQAMPFLSQISVPWESDEFAAEQNRAIKALSRHWVSNEGLGLCQPAPRSHPQLLAAVWSGEDVEASEPRYLTLAVEKLPSGSAEAKEEALGDPTEALEMDEAENGRADVPSTYLDPAVIMATSPDPEVVKARNVDVYALTADLRCRMAAEDLIVNTLNDITGIEEITSVGQVVYAAVRREDETIGGIVLVPRHDPETGLRYRAIEEETGPFVSEAPLTIISRLSPTDEAAALVWREACMMHAKSGIAVH